MDAIQEANSEFLFSSLILTPPINISSGNHFIKFLINDTPLYIQTPKCKVKQGVLKTGKKMFIDLMFSLENEEFIHWIEKIEGHSQEYIYSKRDKWFDSSLEKSDIEGLFAFTMKPFKSGKFYVLRVNVPQNDSNLKIYDEDENLLNLDNLKELTEVICILEFKGIKCAAGGFQIDIEAKQVLILNPTNIFEKCILIKNTSKKSLENLNNQNKSLDKTIKIKSKEKIDLDTQDQSQDQPQNIEMEITDVDIFKDPHEIPDDLEANEQNNEIEIKKEHNEENGEPKDLLEIDLDLEQIEDSVTLKKRNDVYYEMYREALKKAKMAKDLALSSYLEAKRIKNMYMLDDLSETSDLEEDIEKLNDMEN